MAKSADAALAIAERIASIAYDHAVTMHESIIAGEGATGWRDAELLARIATAIEHNPSVEALVAALSGTVHSGLQLRKPPSGLRVLVGLLRDWTPEEE